MALVPHGPGGALVAVASESQPVISEAERQRRVEEANKLEEKLNYIQEEVATRIYNVSGSSAGAGSGDFHQYRMARRREQSRLARMEKAAVEQDEQEEFERKRDQRIAECEERTAKRRAKRDKQKAKKKAKKGSKGEGAAAQGSAAGEGPPQPDEGDSEPEQPGLD